MRVCAYMCVSVCGTTHSGGAISTIISPFRSMRALPSLPPYDKSRSIIYFLSPLFLNRLNAAAVQVPIGLEGEHKGIVDLVAQKAYVFEGDRGEIIREVPIEGAMEEEVKEKRLEMIERLAEVDDQIAELFLGEEEVPIEVLMESIRRQTIALKFVPVFMGSAFKNKGVQKLLDGVLAYLPNPSEVPNYALDLTQGKPAFPPSPPPSLELYSHLLPSHTYTHTHQMKPRSPCSAKKTCQPSPSPSSWKKGNSASSRTCESIRARSSEAGGCSILGMGRRSRSRVWSGCTPTRYVFIASPPSLSPSPFFRISNKLQQSYFRTKSCPLSLPPFLPPSLARGNRQHQRRGRLCHVRRRLFFHGLFH